MKIKKIIISAAMSAMIGVSGLAQAKGLIDVLALPLLAPLYIAAHAPELVPAVAVAVVRPRVVVEPAYDPEPAVVAQPLVYRCVRRPMYLRMPRYRPGWRYGRRGWERDRD